MSAASLVEELLANEEDFYLDFKWKVRENSRGQKHEVLIVAFRQTGYRSVWNGLPWPDVIAMVQVEWAEYLTTAEGYMFVSNSKVDSDFRGNGLGGRLYLEAARLARERGYRGICSDATERSVSASRMWRRLGAQEHDGYSLL